MHSINNGIKEPTSRYQDCNTTQITMFAGYVKVGGSLYSQATIKVNKLTRRLMQLNFFWSSICKLNISREC